MLLPLPDLFTGSRLPAMGGIDEFEAGSPIF
jgi:hypothetical protein